MTHLPKQVEGSTIIDVTAQRVPTKRRRNDHGVWAVIAVIVVLAIIYFYQQDQLLRQGRAADARRQRDEKIRALQNQAILNQLDDIRTQQARERDDAAENARRKELGLPPLP